MGTNININNNFKNSDHIIEGQKVLKQEAEALNLLAKSLNENFSLAVNYLYNTKGRIAVTGMGKSGHVARKVAATLASTGSPSYFIHPSEAGHGDLGMVDTQDVLIAYSNSGETAELSDIILFSARYNIPVIGITKNPNSFLAKYSAATIILPDVLEACPIGCAPTTSTTMMMALGDSLALALLKAKGFTPEDFHKYHPGGKLGQKLLKVKDVMHIGVEIPLVEPDLLMSEVIYVISSKRFGCVGVCNNDKILKGIITDGDLRRQMGPDILNKKAKDIMTKNPITISENILAVKALAIMQEKTITNVFVTDNGQAIGILHIHDCLNLGL